MAYETLTLNVGVGGKTMALDTLAGVSFQRVKFCIGVEGAAVDVSSTDPMPVSAAALPLPTGASTLAEQQTQTTALQLIDDAIHATDAALGKACCVAGQFDDAATATVTENNVAPARITAQRALHVQLRTGSNEAGTSGNPLRTDPTGSTTQPVSGTVGVSGTVTVDTELPAAAALADNTANPTVPGVGAFAMCWDGSAWDRVPGTSADGVLVNLGANNDVACSQSGSWTVTANAGTDLNTSALALESGGNLAAQTTALQLIDDIVHALNDALGKAACIAGHLDDTGTTAATENNVAPVRITAQRGLHINLRNASGTEIGTAGNPIRIDPTGGTPQTVGVSGSVLLDSASSILVQGVDTHDAVMNGAAVGVGGFATASAPTNVNTNDFVRAWFQLNGAQCIELTAAGARIGGDAANGLDVDITRLPASTNTIEVVGDVAAGVAVSGNPVLVGYRADTTAPTAVSDGQAVHPWADEYGALYVKPSCNQISISVTPTIDTAVYASGDRLGSVMTFANAALVSGRSGTIVGALLFDDAPSNFDIRLHLFKVSPTLVNADNSALQITDANLATAIPVGVIEFLSSNSHTYVDNRICQGTWLGGPLAIPFVTSGSSSLFGVLEARGAYDAAAVDDLVVTLNIVRD